MEGGYNMSFLDWLKQLLSNDKREIVKIMGKDITKTIGATDKYCCAVYTQNKTLLKGVQVKLTVNGVTYSRETDSTGVACLNIGLGVGEYSLTATYEGDEQYTDATTTNLIKVAPVLTATDLSMSYHDGSTYKVTAKDSNGNPIANIPVIMTVNGVSYKRITDTNGVASLAINLQAGTYNIQAECYGETITNKIVINKVSTRMEGTDINKTSSQSATYQCAVYTPQNTRLAGNVDITVNGKTYTKTIDSEGLAKLNINLGVGEYTITSEFKGDNNYTSSKVSNKIKVTSDPTPTPTKLYNYLTNTGCSGMGQCNGYYCACNSLQETLYRLTGIHLAESTIASVAGTTTAGTGHSGINTAVAWFNKKYGKNVKIVWKNFSDLGNTDSERWNKLVEYTSNGAVFTHLLYRNKWGHYEPLKSVNKDNVTVLNSLGNKCNSPAYCGYIETRSKSTQLSYMRGISQPSIAYLYI